MNDYLDDFLKEAKEYLDIMNLSLLKLEKGEKDAINEVFRAAHTMKGMAGFMGFKRLEKICHDLETYLNELRNREVSSEDIDFLLKGCDEISKLIEEIEEGKEVKDESKEQKELRIDVKISQDCEMKGVRGLLVLESLAEICNMISTNPDREKIEEGCSFFTVIVRGDEKKVDEVLSRIGEIERYSIEIQAQKEEKPKEAEKKKTEEKLEKIEEKIEEKKEKKRDETVRVNIKVLDNIMNLIGELVIIKGRLVQIATKYDISELGEAVNMMEKSVTRLQDEVMKVRMVKVERVFNRFPRMVRDIARSLGKKVEVVLEGLDTELDRAVLDEMADPLMHLVRNAVDHGIESPEERKTAGKLETGIIRLSARREKNNVVIEIEDDGRGLDVEKIRKKAVEKKIISEEVAQRMNEEELKMLIFLPGFSTKDNISEISGRGVGMDVVKTTVERLGGGLKVISEKGKGTKIRINLPPTIAIIKSLLVEVNGQKYAIPISNVAEAVRVNGNQKTIHGNLFLIVRDKLIPAFKLGEIFGFGNGKGDIGIIIEKEGERYALIVENIVDQQEIVVKPLTGLLSKIRGFSGVTILGDGTVVPIVDVSSLLGGDKFG